MLNQFKPSYSNIRLLAFLESFVELDSSSDEDSSNAASALSASPRRQAAGQQPNRSRPAAVRSELDDYRKLLDDMQRLKILPDTVRLEHSVALWNLAFECSRAK